MTDTQFPGFTKMIWYFIAQYFKSSLNSGRSGDSCSRRAPEIRVVEVRKTIRRRPHFSTKSSLFPSQDTLMGANSSE
jgi:hypothetical protein